MVRDTGDVQARRALRVQSQAVRKWCRRPLLRRSWVGEFFPGCRRAIGGRRLCAHLICVASVCALSLSSAEKIPVWGDAARWSITYLGRVPPIDHPLNLTTQAILTDLSWALT